MFPNIPRGWFPVCRLAGCTTWDLLPTSCWQPSKDAPMVKWPCPSGVPWPDVTLQSKVTDRGWTLAFWWADIMEFWHAYHTGVPRKDKSWRQNIMKPLVFDGIKPKPTYQTCTEETADLECNLKVTHSTCTLHLASHYQNSSKHTKPSIENSTSLWLTRNPDI